MKMKKKNWQPGRFEPATNNQLLATEILYFKIISVFYFQISEKKNLKYLKISDYLNF